MGKPGRKSWTEELLIADRYKALSEPFFKFLKKMLESKNKADRKWAVERLEKAYVRMIPQDIMSAGKPFVLKIDNAFVSSSKKDSKK